MENFFNNLALPKEEHLPPPPEEVVIETDSKEEENRFVWFCSNCYQDVPFIDDHCMYCGTKVFE